MIKSYVLFNLSIGLIVLLSVQLETEKVTAQLLPLPTRRQSNVDQPQAQPAVDQIQFIAPDIPIQADDNVEPVPDAPPMRKEIPLKMTAHIGGPENNTKVTIVLPKTTPATTPATTQAAQAVTNAYKTNAPPGYNYTNVCNTTVGGTKPPGCGASTVFFSKGTMITLFLIVSFVFFGTNKRMVLL